MECLKYLSELTSAYAPSGDESAFANQLSEILSSYGNATVDKMSNVICEISGKGKHFLLDAHIDQIGFVVTSIDSKGFLKVAKCGGVDRRTLLSHEVTVWGKEKLSGIISCQPPHLLTHDSYKKSVDFNDISIDIGMDKKQAESVVSVGDRVTLKYNQNQLLGNCFSASFLDDRSGVASIIMALDILKKSGTNAHITVVFTSQEEVGTRGAGVATFNISADEAIVVDVSFAMTPDSKVLECGELGKGPMIGVAPSLSSEIYSNLKAVAEGEGLPYQLEVMGELTGTNADVISICGSGIKTGLISIPLRYMHTPVETVNVDDVENVAKLIEGYITKKGGK